MKKLFPLFLLIISISASAQVKIGNNPGSINSNSLLELESTNKGFLPPRVTLTDASLITPLTGTVPAGMMVYNSGGSLAYGYYYWNGTSWRLLETSGFNAVAIPASTTITKDQTLVLASGNTTITLPDITSSDNGLAITVKNVGAYTDLVEVQGDGADSIDGIDSTLLTRWQGKTFIAYGGNWLLKTKENTSLNILDVSPTGSWTTIEEVVEFLNMHMTEATVVRLTGTFSIASTQVIDLPAPVTFQGLSYSKAGIEAASGLAGTPMFRCLSETYFKMMQFDGSTLTGYGNSAGEDAIQLETGGEYFEVKDCNFTGFNKTIVAESNVELWLFETDINDAVVAGVEIAAGATDSVSFKVSETDFINCAKGINLVSGKKGIISILNCGFYNTGAQTGVNYIPGLGAFENFSSMFITNNSWNNAGSFFSGFDFTRPDGRDSKAFIQNNAGEGNKNPGCIINVTNSLTGTTLGGANSWAKANWNHLVSTVITNLWTVSNTAGNVNKIVYQPVNRRGGYFIITGNLSVNQPNRNISLAVVKRSLSGTRYGETTLRTGASGTPTIFSTFVYLSDIAEGDWFEIYVSSTVGGEIVTINDVQWFAETK